MTVAQQIEQSLQQGWVGTADDWWAQHSHIKTINSIAPTFTHLKKAGLIQPAGPRCRTRSGGLATPWRWA